MTARSVHTRPLVVGLALPALIIPIACPAVGFLTMMPAKDVVPSPQTD